RRRHTRSDRDWSSDVCSSDLQPMFAPMYAPGQQFVGAEDSQPGIRDTWDVINQVPTVGAATEDVQGEMRRQEVSVQDRLLEPSQIGRASCRERVEMSVEEA